MKGPCQYCGEIFDNPKVHERFCKKRPSDKEGWPYEQNIIVDNYIPEKPLSIIISEIRNVLRSYKHCLEVKTMERNGTTEEIEIVVRFQTRR